MHAYSGHTLLSIAAAVVAAVALTGCGGGGDGGEGGGAQGLLIPTDFAVANYGQTTPGGQPGTTSPPGIFRDQAVLLPFDGNVDPESIGGFILGAGGAPTVFNGLSPSINAGGIPYFAFAQQSVARNAIEIRENVAGGPQLLSYIVGVHRDLPNTIVIDPRVSAVNSFNLPGSSGFSGNTSYVVRIPVGSPLTVGGGTPVQPFGPASLAALPLALPTFTPTPTLSPVLPILASFVPNTTPPQVLSIESSTANAGTGQDPIPSTASIVVTFSQPIDVGSIDVVRNFRVLNQTVLQNGEPSIVPGSLSFAEVDARTVATFTPAPTFGPGPYDINVRVGTFNDPTVPPILGVPTGAQQTQVPMEVSLAKTFVTAACPTCVGATSLVEDFENANFQDGSYEAPLNDARWATAPDVRLAGLELTGAPLDQNLSNQGIDLGNRVQFEVLPTPLQTTQGLVSPFDDATTNIANVTAPNGGAHIMHLYQREDLGSTSDSLELVEWGPFGNVANALPGQVPNNYPQFQMWMGQSTIIAALQNGTGNGMSQAFWTNYDVPTLQTPDPTYFPQVPGQPQVPGGVLVAGPVTYTIPVTTLGPWYPFHPQWQSGRPFEYEGGNSLTHLILEQNIEPGSQLANFTRYRATANNPIRRLVDSPLSVALAASPNPVAPVGGYDVYNMRFTFSSARCSAQSQWYDTALANPDFDAFIINPGPEAQPAGTDAIWELEGAAGVTPIPIQPTGFLTYWTGTPAAGAYDPTVIDQLDGKQFVRFKVTMRANARTNAIQSYTSVLFAIRF